MSNTLLEGGLTTFRWSFILQLLLKVLNFICNGLAFRVVLPELIGLVNLRIGLFLSTLLFLSREAFRRACLSRSGFLKSSPEDDARCDQRVVFRKLINVIWLCIPTGMFVSVILFYVWTALMPRPAIEQASSKLTSEALNRQYQISLAVYAMSGMLELCTEAFWLVSQMFIMVQERVRIEGLANLFRCLGIIGALVSVGNVQEYGLYCLALPQLLHGLSLVLLYVWSFRLKILHHNELAIEIAMSDLMPSVQSGLDREALYLAKEFFTQGILKQFLTEGERYIISGLHLLTFSEQAVYDLVNNLGSIPSRLIFAPLDESCHLIFSKSIRRGQEPCKQDKSLIKQALDMLKLVLRVSCLLSMLGVVFSQAYSQFFMQIYANKADAGGLLRVISVHIFVCGLNGPAEAFMFAAMSAHEIAQFNWIMLAFSGLFLVLSFILSSKLAVYGFLLANTINIFVRFAYSYQYILKFAEKSKMQLESLSEIILPSKLIQILLVLGLSVTLISKNYFCTSTINCLFVHCVIVGLPVVLLVLVFVWREEGKHLKLFLTSKKTS